MDTEVSKKKGMQDLAEFIYEVPFHDTDMASIVYYVNFYKWMDLATHHLFKTIGWPISAVIRNGNGIPLLEAKCTFLSPVRFGDKIVIRSSVAAIKRKSFQVVHHMQRQDTLVAEGYEWRVWVRLVNNGIQSEPIPDELRRAVESEFAATGQEMA